MVMKKLLALIAIFLAATSGHAQNWTKEISNEFKKEKQVAVQIDLSESTIMDVTLADYPEYFSGKYSSNEKYANLILDKFKNRFRTSFYKHTKKVEVSESEAKFILVFEFKSITEKGGFSGTYRVVTQGNSSEEISFIQKDGRWNDFETLLMENADKFWKRIDFSDFNPYSVKLYTQKK